MVIHYQKITIIRHTRPVRANLNDELQWFGSSLGLFNLRDRDSSRFRIFIELLKSAKKNEKLSSDDMAAKLNLSRGTIIHHVNDLIGSGMVVVEKNKYMLRVPNLEILIDELQRDIKRTCEDLRRVAKDIDNFMGL